MRIYITISNLEANHACDVWRMAWVVSHPNAAANSFNALVISAKTVVSIYVALVRKLSIK